MIGRIARVHSLETVHRMIILWLVLNAFDVLTTIVGLRLGALEANPLTAGLIASTGEVATYTVKLLVALVVVGLLCKLGRRLLLKWVNMVMAVIIVSNVAILAYSFSG